MFLMVAPIKGVIRFGKKEKLKLRYIGPFEILERVGDEAYRLAISQNLTPDNDVFYISMLRKYLPDSSHVISHEDIEVNKNFTYEEIPTAILGRIVHTLRNREREDEILAKYPNILN